MIYTMLLLDGPDPLMGDAIDLVDVLTGNPRVAPFGFADCDFVDIASTEHTDEDDIRFDMLTPRWVMKFAMLRRALRQPPWLAWLAANQAGLRLSAVARFFNTGTGTVLAALLAEGFRVRQIGQSTDGIIEASRSSAQRLTLIGLAL